MKQIKIEKKLQYFFMNNFLFSYDNILKNGKITQSSSFNNQTWKGTPKSINFSENEMCITYSLNGRNAVYDNYPYCVFIYD